MKSKLTHTLSSLALALGCSIGTAQNAAINWTVHDITGDINEISTAGTVVLDGARNGNGGTDRTVNGVVFESADNSGNLFNSLFASDNIGSRGYGTVVTDGNYRNFLAQGQRSGRTGTWALPRIATTTAWTTIDFTNLTAGNSYQVQIWASDVGSSANGVVQNEALVLGNGVSTGDPVFGSDAQLLLEVTDFGAGQYAIGYFVANATTQTVNVRQYTNLNGTPSAKSSDHWSNGWQIRDQGLDTSPPSPAPTVASLTPFETSVDIVASTATDQTGVLYRYIRRLGLGGAVELTSDWQESPNFTDTGLTANTEYGYTVQARDKTPTEYTTSESAEIAVTTLMVDTTAPTPATMSFAAAPTALDYQSITMTAVTATDAISDVEYYFTETSGNPGGDDSGWQSSPTYIDSGLNPNTQYTYTVQARDTAATPNLNTASSAESTFTDLKGNANIVWSVSTIADDVNDISTDGSLVDARNGATSSRTVNGVEFLSVALSGDLYDTVFANDNIGIRGYGSVVTDGDYRNFLSQGQRSGRSAPNDYAIIEYFGLTPGNTYQIQIWASDVSTSANTAQNAALVLSNGTGSAPNQGVDAQLFYEAGEDTIGQYGIGTFLANAPNQAFFVQRYNNLNSTPSAGTQDHFSNGWQLRDLGVVIPDNTPPNPDPMTWASVPVALNDNSISMTATTATDENGVEYYFTETSGSPGGDDSGWQDSATYTDSGLNPETQYTYTVIARDKSVEQNETAPSSAESATTDALDDVAPTPDPMTFLVAPIALSSTDITMTATTASDINDVEYYFTETSGNPGGDDSGWQDSATYTDSGLSPGITYSYTVTARDKAPAPNSTAPSEVAFASTNPTALITWTAHNITNDVGNISTNGSLVDARNGSNSSQFVNGTVFESVANSGNLFDSVFTSDSLGVRGYGSVVTALSYRTFLGVGQRSGRPASNTPPQIASTEDWATVTFTGLTVGNTYEIQIWASDVGFAADGIAQATALVLGDGSPGAPVFGNDTQLFYEATDFGAGQYGTGTFVALASTQSFNVQSYNNLDTTPSASTTDHMSNGWQLRDLGPSVTDYDQWVISQGWTPGDPDTGAGDDYDGDGLTNDEERLFGLDSSDASSANPYVGTFDPTTGSFGYTRRSPSLSGLDYQVLYSTDLTQWFEDTGAVQTPGPTVNDVEAVSVDISSALLEETKLFVRLATQASVPPAPAPRLSSLWGNESTITLNFTEEMDLSDATDTANYTVELDGGGAVAVTNAALSGDGKTVTLSLGSPLGVSSAYSVSTSNLTGSGGEPLTGEPTGQFYNWDNDPTGIKVFILVGQSNMVGYGYSEEGNGLVPGAIGSLRYLANNNGSYPEYDYTSLLVNPGDPVNSAWRTRPDVKVWWKNGITGNLDGPEGSGDLGPPFRGGNTAWFGPEYGFGQVIGDYYAGPNEQPVLIIKAAWGGHSLGGNFRPPSAVADRGGVVGDSYHEIFNDTREVLDNLVAKFPAAQHPDFDAVGYRYQIAGIAFHQGYTDRVVPNLSPEYQFNLPDFIDDVRGAFGQPDLPFAIASSGMDTTFVEAAPYPNYTEVEQAQLWVVGEPQPANVRSSDTRSFMESASESPRNQGFHWHGNARSYFRIGKLLGDDMVNLLTP